MRLGRVESSSVLSSHDSRPKMGGVPGHRKDCIKRGFLSSVQDMLGTVPPDSFLRLLIEGSEACRLSQIQSHVSRTQPRRLRGGLVATERDRSRSAGVSL